MIKLQPEHEVFLSVIANLPTPVELVIKQVDGHVKMRLTSQLIDGIARILQRLLQYFNSTIISASFVFPPTGLFPVFFILDLNNSESVKLSFGSFF